MNGTIQIQNPHTGVWENVHVNGLPDPAQPVHIHTSGHRGGHGHPLLIVGIILGLVIGLFAAIPKGARGWVVAFILALILWFSWTAHKDQAFAGTEQPVPAHYSDYAPRAELVRLPNK